RLRGERRRAVDLRRGGGKLRSDVYRAAGRDGVPGVPAGDAGRRERCGEKRAAAGGNVRHSRSAERGGWSGGRAGSGGGGETAFWARGSAFGPADFLRRLDVTFPVRAGGTRPGVPGVRAARIPLAGGRSAAAGDAVRAGFGADSRAAAAAGPGGFGAAAYGRGCRSA